MHLATQREYLRDISKLETCTVSQYASDSENQAQLNVLLGTISQNVLSNQDFQIDFNLCLKYCVSWLMALGTTDISNLVRCERDRQESLVRSGKFQHSSADGRLSDLDILIILTEEIGEVAHEVCDGVAQQQYDKRHLAEELIQCVAVLVGWQEARHERRKLTTT